MSQAPVDPVLAALALAAGGYTAARAQVAAQQAAIAFLLPPDPPDPGYAPDWKCYVSADGDDANPGTEARPFKTLNRAQPAAKANGAALPGIFLRAIDTFASPWNNWLDGPLYVDGSWQATVTSPRAKVISRGVAFGGNGVNNFHLRSLDISPDQDAPKNNDSEYGVYFNGGDDITLDRCVIEGHKTFGAAFIGLATRVRLYRNWIGRTFDPNLSTMSCTGLYTEAVAPDMQSNTFYKNGWNNAVANPNDPANAAEKNAMMFRHSAYHNPSGGNAVAGIDQFNLYLRSASCGDQGRVGNHKMLWCVYWDNGNSVDAFTGAGWNATGTGEIGHFAVFGNLTPDFYCWGGGVSGQSVADNIHDGLFAGSLASMQIDPAVSVTWPGGNNSNQKFPLPPNATAVLSNLRGFWPVSPPVQVLDGRTAVQTNIDIRVPTAVDHVPTLGEYFGFSGTPQQVEQQIAEKFKNPEPQQAQKIISWLSGQYEGFRNAKRDSSST
jgi:hypothetical protein